METSEAQGRMWVDLLLSEREAKNAQHQVTNRALLYLHGGLPLDQVLDALKISRATWYRRVEALEVHRAENKAAGDRAFRRTSQP